MTAVSYRSIRVPGKVLCATNMIDGAIVVGTDQGSLYRVVDDTVEHMHQFKIAGTKPHLKYVSVNSCGTTALFNAYGSRDRVFVRVTPPAVERVRLAQIAKFMPINGSCAISEQEIAYVVSSTFDHDDAESKAYAFTLKLSDKSNICAGEFRISADNQDVYCEAIKRYDGPETSYFKPSCLYGQFRTWDRARGYIHRVDTNTHPDTGYRAAAVRRQPPIIFDFVPKRAQMACVYGDGTAALLCLKTDKVLATWALGALRDDMQPGICAGTDRAVVSLDGNEGYVLDLTDKAATPERARFTAATKSIDGSQLVMLRSAAFEAGGHNDLDQIYGRLSSREQRELARHHRRNFYCDEKERTWSSW